MASVFDNVLNNLGSKSNAQKEREASPVLLALSQRRQPTYNEIQEQKRINREAGVDLPLYEGRLAGGETLRNIGGISYVVQGDGGVSTSNQEQLTPGGIDMFEAALSVPDAAPSYQQPIMPTRREMVPPSRQGMFNPPPMPVANPPTLDTTIDDLMAQMQGNPPAAPEVPNLRPPTRQDLGLPSFTTPGFAPPGLMTPNQPQIPNVNIQALVPDQQQEVDLGANAPQYTGPRFEDMTDAELNIYFDNLIRSQQ